MSTITTIDRRSFLKMVGGGIIVCVSLDSDILFADNGRSADPSDFNTYLRINENGRVTIFSSKIEMGQGVMTSQAQMAAEELGVALEAVDMVLGDTDSCPWDRGTFGSLTTRMFGPVLRAAAAEARSVLMQLAAEKLGVKSNKLAVNNGVVSAQGNSNKKVSYAELTQGKAIARSLNKEAVLRSIKEFNVMGQSPTRFDAHDKVTGAAKYAGDIMLPNMQYARILRPPGHGAKLKKVDTSAAASMKGVTVINQDSMIAVLAADPEMAERALSAITAEWSNPTPGPDQDGIFDYLVKSAPDVKELEKRGNLKAGAKGAHTFEATYHKGYVAHAPIEPHTATAEFKDGKLTIWAATQTPFPTRDRIAGSLGMDKSQVRLITPYVGGGFGGKSASGQADEVAKLAVISGKPVQLMWTREEEFFYDTYDPACIVKINSAVNNQGKITLWDYRVWFAGSRSTDLFYDVANVRQSASSRSMFGGYHPHHFAVGPWRAPGANMNVWARESQIDTMAASLKMDPLEFRLKNLSDKRMKRVLSAAAEKFGWQEAPSPSGRGVGIACGIDAGTYVALMAEVAVNKASGKVDVKRVVCAQDMGIVVNPDGATMQVEGCITQGLGYVFSEELRFQGGQILDKNFGTYRIPTFSEVPRIETVLVKNDGLAPQGGGEPAIVPMGGVIANAIFDATGARVTRLPVTPKRMREILNDLT